MFNYSANRSVSFRSMSGFSQADIDMLGVSIGNRGTDAPSVAYSPLFRHPWQNLPISTPRAFVAACGHSYISLQDTDLFKYFQHIITENELCRTLLLETPTQRFIDEYFHYFNNIYFNNIMLLAGIK